MFMATPRTLLLLAMLCVAAVSVFVHEARREPRFEARDWRYWLQELNTCDDARHEHARHAFRAMGDGLVPVLVRALRKDDSWIAKGNDKWGNKLPNAWRRWLPTCGDAGKIRAQAAEAFSTLGPEAKRAVPDLVAALSDASEDASRNAADALGRIGPAARDAVPALAKLLASPANSLEVAAAQALGRIGSNSAPAVPGLIRNLSSPTPLVCASAASALGKIGGPATDACVALIALTRDADDYVRTSAVVALGKLGAKHPETLVALTAALWDSSYPVRVCAVEALGEIGTSAKPAVPAIVNAQLCDQSGLGRFVVSALRKIAAPNDAVEVRP